MTVLLRGHPRAFQRQTWPACLLTDSFKDNNLRSISTM